MHAARVFRGVQDGGGQRAMGGLPPRLQRPMDGREGKLIPGNLGPMEGSHFQAFWPGGEARFREAGAENLD